MIVNVKLSNYCEIFQNKSKPVDLLFIPTEHFIDIQSQVMM